MADVLWQPSLLESGGDPRVDRSFSGLVHHDLDEKAWIEHVPGWVANADVLFEHLLTGVSWRHHTRRMYDKVVDQPRLDASWKRSSGEPILPVIAEMLEALTERYERPFTTGGLNLYRDGRDSVAWHGDRIPKDVVDPVVGIVSLGAPRTFRLRPKGGGRSVAFVPGPGDLLVTGGTCQRTWEHSVPKTTTPVGPRISMTFRHTAY
jgi:alkylated DNA repair dioxygenase AlkB